MYYALAIAVALQRSSGAISDFKIKATFLDEIDESGDQGSLIERWMIWDRAVAWLLARNMMKIKHDPFGPPVFTRSADFTKQWNELVKDEELPFSTYDAAGQSDDWLIPALHSLDNHFVNMGIKAEDFENPDAEWAPIEVDSDDPDVKKAVSSLEQIIEEVRSDNGYSATLPQERDFVLQGLQGTLDKFKSSSVSAGYVRIAIERLGMLARRFAGTIKETAIAGAKVALTEFAKKHFGDVLNYLWKWPF